MDELEFNTESTPPQRRARSAMQVVKEDYLPIFTIAITLILVIWFIIGSIMRTAQRKNYNNELLQKESIAAQQQQEALEAEITLLLAEAAVFVEEYDYNSALAVLDRFSGSREDFPEFAAKYAEYQEGASKYQLWDDPSKVLNLSFHPLIADPSRGLIEVFYANNYITITEFSNILLDLYENGYTLVRYNDLIDKDGKMHIYMPKGKRPLIITETQVNYNMESGKGFANKLVVDEAGNLACEMIDASGATLTGAYDVVPILEAFIKEHPDFSYRGARAVLALTGYEGLFGYRTDVEAQVTEVKKVIDAVKNAGYELACYTYGNAKYGELTADEIKSDLELWKTKVTPLLGQINLFVMAKTSDIAGNDTAYSGEKFAVLKSYGFTDFIGFSEEGERWFNTYDGHNRMGRVLVTGANLKDNATWYEGAFDPYTIKDPLRR